MITAKRQTEILRGQTSCAQRVFSAVPAQSQWSTTQIHQELARLGIHIDRAKIMGSLKSLIDSGLVTEKGSQFQRAEIKRAVAKQEPKTGDQQMAVSKQAQNALIKKPVPQDASNLDKLGALSSRVIQLAAQLKEIASDIDAAAIEIVEQKATDDANVAKLKQLQALLKEIG